MVCVIAGIIVLIILIIFGIGIWHKFFPRKENRYIPTITVSASIDGGKTYISNIKSIPYWKTFYLKFEIEIKTKRIFREIFNNVIPFRIIYVPNDLDYRCELYDYSGEFDITSKDNKKYFKQYNVSIKSNTDTADSICKYDVFLSMSNEHILQFMTVASDKPKKSEVILKLSRDDSSKYPPSDCRFTVCFGDKVHKSYSKTLKLGFVDHLGNIL
jgi:hypothetical protein